MLRAVWPSGNFQVSAKPWIRGNCFEKEIGILIQIIGFLGPLGILRVPTKNRTGSPIILRSSTGLILWISTSAMPFLISYMGFCPCRLFTMKEVRCMSMVGQIGIKFIPRGWPTWELERVIGYFPGKKQAKEKKHRNWIQSEIAHR